MIDRRLFMIGSGLAGLSASPAHAQFGGGRSRNRGDSGTPRDKDKGGADRPNPAAADPVIAIDRELQSLRLDLALTGDQAATFDAFAHSVHDAADVARSQARDIAGLRHDDGNALPAATVLATLSDDARQRADALGECVERLTRLQGVLTPDQRKHFDTRIVQSLREPLGTS